MRSNSAVLIASVTTAASMVALRTVSMQASAHIGSKATDLGGIARQAGLVVIHNAGILPDDVLGPACAKLLIGEVDGVLPVKYGAHESNR